MSLYQNLQKKLRLHPLVSGISEYARGEINLKKEHPIDTIDGQVVARAWFHYAPNSIQEIMSKLAKGVDAGLNLQEGQFVQYAEVPYSANNMVPLFVAPDGRTPSTSGWGRSLRTSEIAADPARAEAATGSGRQALESDPASVGWSDELTGDSDEPSDPVGGLAEPRPPTAQIRSRITVAKSSSMMRRSRR